MVPCPTRGFPFFSASSTDTWESACLVGGSSGKINCWLRGLGAEEGAWWKLALIWSWSCLPESSGKSSIMMRISFDRGFLARDTKMVGLFLLVGGGRMKISMESKLGEQGRGLLTVILFEKVFACHHFAMTWSIRAPMSLWLWTINNFTSFSSTQCSWSRIAVAFTFCKQGNNRQIFNSYYFQTTACLEEYSRFWL